MIQIGFTSLECKKEKLDSDHLYCFLKGKTNKPLSLDQRIVKNKYK